MNKQVALITGAGRGIGKGVAECLSAAGFDIAIDDVWEPKEVQETLETIKAKGSEVLYIKADISNAVDRKRIVDETKQKFGRLDVLVNNAGVAPKQRLDILEATEESFDRLMNINLKGPYFLTQLVANWMIEQKKADEKRDPKIVNISSISAYTSSPARGEYCVSKAGISMMTMLYADRLAEYNINVYEIRPGIIMTDMTSVVKEKYDKLILEEGLLPIKRWGYPQDIGLAVTSIAKGLMPYSTGEVINVDGGFHLRRL
jgi:NAD(P)-dependent dehydrogenase (short-subunit alcohol dehydrogenase family)